jgi:indole-3-glycerol phosphate synthase
MATILERIVQTKQQEIADAMRRCPLRELQHRAASMPPTRDWTGALARRDRIGLIAEVKRASPSKGVLRADFDPVAIARAYVEGGADALSVLTDRDYFQGALEYLEAIRAAVEIPLLRKDFLIDPYQVFEARAAGADAVLLIAECLSPSQMIELRQCAVECGMETLIELYDPRHLPAVLETGTRWVGVNNRDLHTFEVDLQRAVRLRPQVPEGRYLVAESGIRDAQDATLLWGHGVQAILVGESLMRQPDIATAVRQLLGRGDKL